MMKVGLVILNYNDAETVEKLIKHINNCKSINNIVVVDNKSTDDSYNILKCLTKELPFDLILSDKNRGYASGNNYGAKYLIEKYGSDIIIITNPDILFEEELIKAIVEGFVKHEEYALLAGVMCDPKGNVDRAPYRKLNTYQFDILDCFAFGRAFHEKERNLVQFTSDILQVEVIQGSFSGFW